MARTCISQAFIQHVLLLASAELDPDRERCFSQTQMKVEVRAERDCADLTFECERVPFGFQSQPHAKSSARVQVLTSDAPSLSQNRVSSRDTNRCGQRHSRNQWNLQHFIVLKAKRVNIYYKWGTNRGNHFLQMWGNTLEKSQFYSNCNVLYIYRVLSSFQQFQVREGKRALSPLSAPWCLWTFGIVLLTSSIWSEVCHLQCDRSSQRVWRAETVWPQAVNSRELLAVTEWMKMKDNGEEKAAVQSHSVCTSSQMSSIPPTAEPDVPKICTVQIHSPGVSERYDEVLPAALWKSIWCFHQGSYLASSS